MLSTELSPEIWLSMNCSRVCTFAFGNGFSAVSSAASLVLRRSPACHLEERVEVLRLRVLGVPRRRRDRDGAERRAARRRVEDALHRRTCASPR